MMNIAVICAGGNGERMKTKENKVFLQIGDKPLIYYTLKTFSDYARVNAIVITIGSENVEKLEDLIAMYDLQKIIAIEEAYPTRQESTYCVVEKLKRLDLPNPSYLLIHNAVNPFVKHSELDKCLDAAQEHGASLLGFEAADTMKIVDRESHFIEHTPDRNTMWIAQTPQIIRFDIAVRAFEFASVNGIIATDDSTLVEAIHERVKFVPCSRENFKVTYPQDLEFARQVLSSRVREKSYWYA
jgi:2-C-methyl-D-erythritol 4-phosphate cytidylyltransferase